MHRESVKILLVLCSIVFVQHFSFAQTLLNKPNLGEPSKIAPFYFGPNAFPVPDMLDGEVSGKLLVELGGDYYVGFAKDWTADVFAKLSVPLFTERARLTVWMPFVEFYGYTAERKRQCRLSDSIPSKGHDSGDVYVATEIYLLKEKTLCPALAIRAALKAASSDKGFYNARNYDCPGYFFDATLAKSIKFKNNFFEELRFVGSTGFLCWQTDNGRQNDAVMYGLRVKLQMKYLTIQETWSGYVGWEKDGDRPMTLKTNVVGRVGNFEPFFSYQYGLKDYPFHQFRLGLSYRIDVLNGVKKKTKSQ